MEGLGISCHKKISKHLNSENWISCHDKVQRALQTPLSHKELEEFLQACLCINLFKDAIFLINTVFYTTAPI